MEQIRLDFDSHFTFLYSTTEKEVRKWKREKKRNWKRTLQRQIELLSLNRKWVYVCVCFFISFQQIRHRTKTCQLKHWIINSDRKRTSNKSIFILIPLSKYLFYIYRDTTSGRFSLLQFFFFLLVVSVCRCHFYNAASMILCDIRYCLPFDFGIQCRFCIHSLLYLLAVSFWFLAVFFSVYFFSYNRLRVSVLGYFAHIFFCHRWCFFSFSLSPHSERRTKTPLVLVKQPKTVCAMLWFPIAMSLEIVIWFHIHIWKLMTQ